MNFLNCYATIFACMLICQTSNAECLFPNQQDVPEPVDQALSLAGYLQPSISRYLQIRSVNTEQMIRVTSSANRTSSSASCVSQETRWFIYVSPMKGMVTRNRLTG